MSLSTLTSLAVARDLTAAGAPLTDAAMSAGRGTVAPAAATDANAPAPPLAEGQVDAVAGSPQDSGQPPSAGAASFTQLLVAQIPSEALVAYTTLLALFSAGTDGSYNIGRWILYSVTLLVCAITVLANYLSRRTYVASPTGTPAEAAPPTAPGRKPGPLARIRALHLPYLPASAAVLAMAVYGLTVPGSPLQSDMSRSAFAILSGCRAVGGGVMMSIIAPFLGKGNGMTPAQRRS